LAIHYCCNRFTAPQRIGAGEFLIELDDFFISRQYFNRALQFLLVASADCRLVLDVCSSGAMGSQPMLTLDFIFMLDAAR
jgi:hypothetical protein